MSLNGHWFITLDGSEHGPLSVLDLRALAEAGRIDGETPVSNAGIIGVLPAKRISGVIGSALETVIDEPDEPSRAARPRTAAKARRQSTAEAGEAAATATYFVRMDGQEQGPFSSEQLKVLADAQRITPDTRVRRQGIDGTASARRMPSLFTPEMLAAHPLRQGDGSSAERPVPRIAFFRVDDAGKEVGPLSPDQLRKLAVDGVVTPTTRLRRDGATGTFSARRIHGLFPAEVMAAYEKPGAGEPRMPDALVDAHDDTDTAELAAPKAAARSHTAPVAKHTPAPQDDDAVDDDEESDHDEVDSPAPAKRGLWSFFRRTPKPTPAESSDQDDLDDEGDSDDGDDVDEEEDDTAPRAERPARSSRPTPPARRPTVKGRPAPAAKTAAVQTKSAEAPVEDAADPVDAKTGPESASARKPGLRRQGKRRRR